MIRNFFSYRTPYFTLAENLVIFLEILQLFFINFWFVLKNEIIYYPPDFLKAVETEKNLIINLILID